MKEKARWLVIFFCFLAIAVNYIDRANLAVAAPHIMKDLGIGPAGMGLLLSGFFWTYAVMQLPFGWFVDRIGARIALPLAVGWWSVFTAATAVASGFAAMFGCRLMLGAGEAGAYPSCAKLVSQWFARDERALATSIYDSGSRTGSALSLPIVAAIIGAFGWRASFAITGVLGLVWIAGWLALYREPAAHAAFATRKAAAAQTEAHAQPAGPAIRWSTLFRYRTVWGMMFGFFCLNFVIYFFITWFPSYLVDVRGFSLKSLGTLGVLPAIASIPGGWFGGWLSDALVRRGWSATAARKTCIVGGMLLSSVITLTAVVPGVYEMLALFAVAYGSLAAAAASIWSLPADVAPTPQHVASLAGIQNFASNLAGIALTTFTGVMLQMTKGSFTIPLVVAGVFCVLGAASYLFVVGRVEPLNAKRDDAIDEQVYARHI
ncbi:MFS transporter [Paraburkholderia solisilvae]|uniref:Putative galactarate transporter n=1 Tax=Paraburkholderia solisilvae TaxID=624376 RepID=A0A6J5E5J5_9BURK|nr:MFS transporter [Paraburkholderia solisilvae]CAB3761789.1 putative galactarate transporter [Paraburkholderia solisilvae]